MTFGFPLHFGIGAAKTGITITRITENRLILVYLFRTFFIFSAGFVLSASAVIE